MPDEYGTPETSGVNGPIILIFIGALIAFSVFLFQSPWVLVLGLAMVVGGGIWAGINNQQPGTGLGASTIQAEDRGEED